MTSQHIGNDGFRHFAPGDDRIRKALFGNLDEHLDLIRELTQTEIYERGDEFLLRGGNSELAADVLAELVRIAESGQSLNRQKVSYVIALKQEGQSYADKLGHDIVCFTTQGFPIKAKTIAQKAYVESVRKRDVVFAIGPAGTGKTYLAVASAVASYKNGDVKRILLARPAVESGERLGFLPGDLQEKVDPYLRPLYDALYEILGRETTIRLKEKETIEIVPLAYMRGRTLRDSFIILDEAQNATREQMKMFLTRMGFGSKVVVTGDITQIDLPRGQKSGLVEAQKVLEGVEGIDFCYLRDVDVVRHEMVRRIVRAYEAYGKREAES